MEEMFNPSKKQKEWSIDDPNGALQLGRSIVELVIIYIWVSPCKGHTILGGLGPFHDTIHSNKP